MLVFFFKTNTVEGKGEMVGRISEVGIPSRDLCSPP